MNADVTPVRDALVGTWFLDAGGMQSQVTLSPDGQYSNTLAGGMQGHAGTWAVSNNPLGGQTIVFTLATAFPQNYVGPLGTVPITWPKHETRSVTSIQPDHILIQGGSLRRMQPGESMPFAGGMTMTDFNAEAEKEMHQIADAGRKVAGTLKNMWSAFKKR